LAGISATAYVVSSIHQLKTVCLCVSFWFRPHITYWREVLKKRSIHIDALCFITR